MTGEKRKLFFSLSWDVCRLPHGGCCDTVSARPAGHGDRCHPPDFTGRLLQAVQPQLACHAR